MKTHTVYTYRQPFQNQGRTTVDACAGEYSQIEHGLPVGLVSVFSVRGVNTNREAIAAVLDSLDGQKVTVEIERLVPTK